jgi:hypothetical protein
VSDGRRPRRAPRRRGRRPDRADGSTPRLLERIPRWIEIAAAAIAVAGAAYAALTFIADRTEDLIGNGNAADLEVRQVVVANGPTDARLTDGALRQTSASTPQLDITVRNTGREGVLLTRARVKVVDVARLTVCEYATGGEVSLAGDYATELPTVPLPDERVVVRPLHQEVPAGGVDRFKLWFRTPPQGEDNLVYALRVTLGTDRPGDTVSVGRFVLGVPEATTGDGGRQLAVPPFRFVPSYQYRLQSTWCLRRNLAELKRVLGRQGKRSPQMRALADLRLSDSWPAFSDDRPAAAAVEPLLDSEVGPPALLAVFAAERAGDPDLLARTRKRAAALLLHEAEHGLDLGYSFSVRGAVDDLHYALLFAPSPQARELLGTAEAQLLVAEATEATPSGGE